MTEPQTSPLADRRPCYFTLPNGVPFLDQSTFDRLHHHVGALSHLASTTDGIGGTERLDDDGVADLLDSARYTANLANEALQLAVDTARDHGWTWEQIGKEFGITKQAAGKRFGPVVRTKVGAK